MSRGLGHPEAEGSLACLVWRREGLGMSAATSSTSYPSLVFVQAEGVGMNYLICKTCFQATNCCKRRKLNIWKFYVGRFYFLLLLVLGRW